MEKNRDMTTTGTMKMSARVLLSRTNWRKILSATKRMFMLRLVEGVGADDDRSSRQRELFEAAPECKAKLGIEADSGLIEQKDLWPMNDRAAQGNPLPHAAGEALHGGPLLVLEVKQAQDFLDPSSPLVTGPDPVDRAEKVEVVEHGQLGIEG